jgi:hypothetical protein
LPMLVRISVLGRMPASDSLLALTMTMQRILILLWVSIGAGVCGGFRRLFHALYL